ncbi:MAG: sigma-70 family RNA polymerase sigma factor [Dehalococcoidia bacterium]
MTDPAPRRQRPEIRTHLRDVTSGDGASTRARTAGADRAADDAVLMEALGRGDLQALEALYDRYSALVFSVSLRVLHDPQLAEDVVQEVFLRLWRQPASFDPGRGRFISWLMSVTRNRALDELRRVSRRNRSEDQEEDESNPLDALATSDRMDDPVLGAELREQREAVRTAMTRLPPEQRRAIELAYFSGLTQAEISDVTGDPLGTVKTRIRLGMRKLRDALTEFVDGTSETDEGTDQP